MNRNVLFKSVMLFFIMSILSLSNISAQSTNTIDADGTTADQFYIGNDSTAKAAVGIPQYEAPTKNWTIGDKLISGSQSFASGWTGAGWQLGYDDSSGYTLELDNLILRHGLTVNELIVNKINAQTGNVFFSSTGRVKGAFGNFVFVENPDSDGTSPFDVDDIIMTQVFNMSGSTIIRDAKARVITKTFAANMIRLYVNYYTSDVFQPGDVIVRIGNTSNTARQNSIYFATSGSNTPYMDMISGVASVSDFTSFNKVIVRVGNLTGINDPDLGSLSGDGVYINNAYIKGHLIATNPEDFIQIVYWDDINNKPTYTNSPTGSGLYLSGSNFGFYNATQFPSDPWRTYMDNQGRLYLKGNSSNTLTWDGSALNINATFAGNGNALTISANSTITGINSTLSTHTTQISQNTNAITFKADQVDLDEAFDTLSVHNSRILQNAQSITTKVSETSFNTLSGTVSTHTSQITQMATDISLRLLESDFSGYNIISEINLTTSGARIAGKTITLDGDVNVTGTFSVNGQLITPGSITYDKLSVANLSAISATLGSAIVGTSSTVGYLQSYDYVSGSTGWKIAKGLAEFNGATLKGSTITSGTIQTAASGQRITINESGYANTLRFYDGSNNLAGGISASTSGGYPILNFTAYDVRFAAAYVRNSGDIISSQVVSALGGFEGGSADQFVVNSSGQLVCVNNMLATSGYALVGDGTSFTPIDLLGGTLSWTGAHTWTKSVSGSYYNIVSNTETSNASALSGFYAKANQSSSQAGVAMQAFASQYSDATLAGFGRIATDGSLNGLVLGVGTSDIISFRINNVEKAKVNSSGIDAVAYYDNGTLKYLSSGWGAKSAAIGTTSTGTVLYSRSKSINGVTVNVVTLD